MHIITRSISKHPLCLREQYLLASGNLLFTNQEESVRSESPLIIRRLRSAFHSRNSRPICASNLFHVRLSRKEPILRSICRSYYQWTSIALLCMAILFTLPSHLWNTLSNPNGINLKTLIKMIKEDRNDKEKIHHLRKLVRAQINVSRSIHLRSFLHRKLHRTSFCGRFTSLLFVIKFLFLINTLGQLLFLTNFLSLRPTDFNLALVDKELHRGVGGFESIKFPRVVMCDFMIRELGSNQHWYTVQCNLPINIYNEAIFMGIVFWLIILIILNGLSIIRWALSLVEINRKRSILRSLRFYENLEPKIMGGQSPPMAKIFVNYIGVDGFIFLHIIGRNTDELFMIETIGYLYEHFLQTINKTEKCVV